MSIELYFVFRSIDFSFLRNTQRDNTHRAIEEVPHMAHTREEN